jgi:hypothetical protein
MPALVPTTTMTSASAAPTQPSLRCTSVRRAATSAVWAMKNAIHVVNSAP